MQINYSWNFHQNIFTLTISFIVLNAAIEFVLIYRPHPVHCEKNKGNFGVDGVQSLVRRIYVRGNVSTYLTFAPKPF